MARTYTQKTVLITGGSRGLGKGIAEIFANNNCNVVISYLNKKDLANKVCDKLRNNGVEAIAVQCDISRSEDCKRLILEVIANFRKIDILINNAGQYNRHPTEKERAYFSSMRLNGVESLMQLAHQQGAESIVNISSLYCVNHSASPFTTALHSSVESYTLYYAKLFKGKTRVNCIRPGYCDTNILNKNYTSKEIREFLKRMPGNKLITPNEMGEVVYFVATNPLLTGQIITADKGATLQEIS